MRQLNMRHVGPIRDPQYCRHAQLNRRPKVLVCERSAASDPIPVPNNKPYPVNYPHLRCHIRSSGVWQGYTHLTELRRCMHRCKLEDNI